jgi:ABC-2 type transport system ATP-binding protein
MEEADFLSDRIAIIDGVKIIAIDTPQNLKNGLSEVKSVKFQIENTTEKLISDLENLQSIKNVISDYNPEARNYTLTMHHTDGETIMQNILDVISKNKCRVISVNVLEPSLEDVFISLTGKSLRE